MLKFQNSELEKFAYATSHVENLRKVDLNEIVENPMAQISENLFRKNGFL